MTESTDRRVRKIKQLKESTARPRNLLHNSRMLASPLMRAQTGLSTLEYAVLFILLLVGSLTAWSKLGKDVQTKVDEGQNKFSNVLQDALTNSNKVAPSDSFQVGGQSPRPKGSPSSSNGRMGKSTGHQSSHTSGQSGAGKPSTSGSAVVISKSPPSQSNDPNSPIDPVTSAGTLPIGSTSSPEQGSSSPYGQGHLVDRTGFFDRIMGQELGTTGKILVGAAGAVVGAGMAMASEAALAYGSSLGCGPGAPVCSGIATVGLLGYGVYSMVNGGWEAMKGSFGRVFSSEEATVSDALNVGMTAGGAIYGLGKIKVPKRGAGPQGTPAQGVPDEALGAIARGNNPASKSGGAAIAQQAGRNASQEIRVIGRQADTAVARDWPGHKVLNDPKWTLTRNDAWIAEGIANKQPFYMASPRAGNMVQTSGRFAGKPTVYARELRQLEAAGYRRIGDYMVHPDNIGTFIPP